MSEPTRYERLGVILVDATGTEIGGAWLSQDCQDGTTFRLRDLARVALHHDATGMILVHTHPHSAEPKPSKLDIETTRTVHEYFLRVGIPVLDHRIYGAGCAAIFSFAQQAIEWSIG
jgi:DNA repair protein RadC